MPAWKPEETESSEQLHSNKILQEKTEEEMKLDKLNKMIQEEENPVIGAKYKDMMTTGMVKINADKSNVGSDMTTKKCQFTNSSLSKVDNFPLNTKHWSYSGFIKPGIRKGLKEWKPAQSKIENCFIHSSGLKFHE